MAMTGAQENPAPESQMLELSHAIAAQHAAIDAQVALLAQASGLACPPGCGACCLSPEVETSVADALPLALALFARGEAPVVLERAREAADRGPCVLYRADPLDPRRGRCSAYAERPSICRLFGFSSRRARAGGVELATCRELRAGAPEAVARAEEHVRTGGAAARIDVDAERIAFLEGGAPHPLPINQALRLALERVGLARALAARARPKDG